MTRIGVFGCKSTTTFILETVQAKTQISSVITIDSELAKRHAVADYCDLSEFCRKHHYEQYSAQDYSLGGAEDVAAIEAMNLDIAFVIGWQRIIPKPVLDSFSIGVFGMHGSTDDLPIGRGRSPMNWSLIERRNHFYTNLFRYDPGVDSGDILDTFVFSIQSGDTAETMHFKNTLAMKYLITKNLADLMANRFTLKKQKAVLPTFYPKRTPDDSLIDWNKDVFQLQSFIRAVTKPFNGAFSYIHDTTLRIFRAEIFETDLVDFGYSESRNGTVLEVFPNQKFLVKCRGGILLIHEYACKLPVEAGQQLASPKEAVHQFKLNQYGYHDLPS